MNIDDVDIIKHVTNISHPNNFIIEKINDKIVNKSCMCMLYFN